MKSVRGFSPGKVIISGEHSVVYGHPAIVSALNLGVTVEVTQGDISIANAYLDHLLILFKQHTGMDTNGLHITSTSSLLQKSGLGSSAAFAHATFQALFHFFKIPYTVDQMYQLVIEGEKYIHQNPSGVDPAAVVYGGLQLFTKTQKGCNRTKIQVTQPVSFTLINSGPAYETTGEMVQRVRHRLTQQPRFINSILHQMGRVTHDIQKSFISGTFTGVLLSENQRFLEIVGVVGKKAQAMVASIEASGGAAKITGAGGIQAGSGWLLAYHQNLSALKKLINRNSWENYQITVQ
jgi:mevalonate kinase